MNKLNEIISDLFNQKTQKVNRCVIPLGEKNSEGKYTSIWLIPSEDGELNKYKGTDDQSKIEVPIGSGYRGIEIGDEDLNGVLIRRSIGFKLANDLINGDKKALKVIDMILEEMCDSFEKVRGIPLSEFTVGEITFRHGIDNEYMKKLDGVVYELKMNQRYFPIKRKKQGESK